MVEKWSEPSILLDTENAHYGQIDTPNWLYKKNDWNK